MLAERLDVLPHALQGFCLVVGIRRSLYLGKKCLGMRRKGRYTRPKEKDCLFMSIMWRERV